MNSKRFMAIALVVLLHAATNSTSSRAEIITGTFNGYVSGVIVHTDGSAPPVVRRFQFGNDPGTFSFRMDVFAPDLIDISVLISDKANGFGAFAQSLPLAGTATIVDGIPGVSPDLISSSFVFLSGKGAIPGVATFELLDTSGQFLGPNGNGDRSGIFVRAEMPVHQSGGNGVGDEGFLRFSTRAVPEPSSVVMLALGAIILAARRFHRLRRSIGQ